VGRNSLNSIKALADFDITTTLSMNYSSLLEEKCASIRQTFILKQLSQMSTLLDQAHPTHEARLEPELTLSALSESLAALTQAAEGKLPSWPSQMYGPAAGTLYGMPYYLSERIIERVPDGDWSRCRSPARAKRRLRYGFPQHVVWERPSRSYYVYDGCIFMHPHTAALIQNELEKTWGNLCVKR
jgi:hypothetical protein